MGLHVFPIPIPLFKQQRNPEVRKKDNTQNGSRCLQIKQLTINLQTAHGAQYQQNKQVNQKMGGRPN